MSYIDLAIGLGVFLFFIALVLGLSVKHFVKVPIEVTIEEYREAAMDMFERFFTTAGAPDDWEDTGQMPSEIGLVKFIYRIPITVKEPGIDNRTNEPVVANLYLDDECESVAWNTTVRVYDSSLNAYEYELVNAVNCSSQYLNESYIRFSVNMSKNEERVFYVFYSEDTDISDPNYTMSYSTNSWQHTSGDAWTDTTSGWNRYGGSTATPANNDTDEMMGELSVQIKDTFSAANILGLRYQPGSAITGVENGWYADAWINVDDLTGVSYINVSIGENSDIIVTTISTSDMDSSAWYHFERNLTSSDWEDWSDFDASDGIDNITFYMVNSSADITRQLKVDEVHFELWPLTVKTFPAEKEKIISRKKISALNNLTYEELRDITGEDYRFRIEIED